MAQPAHSVPARQHMVCWLAQAVMCDVAVLNNADRLHQPHVLQMDPAVRMPLREHTGKWSVMLTVPSHDPICRTV